MWHKIGHVTALYDKDRIPKLCSGCSFSHLFKKTNLWFQIFSFGMFIIQNHLLRWSIFDSSEFCYIKYNFCDSFDFRMIWVDFISTIIELVLPHLNGIRFSNGSKLSKHRLISLFIQRISKLKVLCSDSISLHCLYIIKIYYLNESSKHWRLQLFALDGRILKNKWKYNLCQNGRISHQLHSHINDLFNTLKYHSPFNNILFNLLSFDNYNKKRNQTIDFIFKNENKWIIHR